MSQNGQTHFKNLAACFPAVKIFRIQTCWSLHHYMITINNPPRCVKNPTDPETPETETAIIFLLLNEVGALRLVLPKQWTTEIYFLYRHSQLSY